MPKQMAIPFALGPDGSIASVTDPIQSLADRVRALTATLPTQRVMRSTFGVATTRVVFDWDATIAQEQLNQMVREAVALWEPSARVLSVKPVLTQDGSQVIAARVDISAGDPVGSGISPQYTVTVAANGEVARRG
ncbi:GPW/gp25 family protein [Streptomyces sp. NPDC005551]|uniref:GPW/gp25 family protein n=1 Tax=Streptomyces sp. NPDC005551 TaxID=3364725 RepID=UPI003690E9DC